LYVRYRKSVNRLDDGENGKYSISARAPSPSGRPWSQDEAATEHRRRRRCPLAGCGAPSGRTFVRPWWRRPRWGPPSAGTVRIPPSWMADVARRNCASLRRQEVHLPPAISPFL